MSRVIHVQDSLQKGYEYVLEAPPGLQFSDEFNPELTPKEMLEVGVFGGDYFHGEHNEFPPNWFNDARLSETHDPTLNFFEVDASQPLHIWVEKGWIYEADPRGWFQWYCRYYFGRRIPQEDERQIGRWKAMLRHIGQIKKACYPGDLTCRRRQRQALLHWAYDSRKI